MTPPPNRFDRARHNRARVAFALACAAGSAAWSLAGRGAEPTPELRRRCPAHIELGDRALPILSRN